MVLCFESAILKASSSKLKSNWPSLGSKVAQSKYRNSPEIAGLSMVAM